MTHPTDDEIMELAGSWFHTGENQKRDDGYYYRSLGTPSNVRGSDLIEFARALLAAQPAVQQPKHAPTQLRDCGELMEAIKGMAAMLFGQGAAQQYPFDAWRLLESYIEQMTAIVHEAQRSAVQQPAEDAPSDAELADTPTPKPQGGMWTLTAPDGRTYQADSPLRCCGLEQRERVPADVAMARIFRAASEPDDSELLDWLDATNKRFKMGWKVGVAPAGNCSVQSIICLGNSEPVNIRAAIRAAIAQERKA